ncbi:MAG: hypothetical protein ACRYGA_10805 [Janthinobacterium lividum]
MTGKDWDTALVVRANELLVEVRRYHADAEATRLQLASAATMITRKVDELPQAITQSIQVSLQQRSSVSEHPALSQRLDRSTRALSDLATQLQSAGTSFLNYWHRVALLILISSTLAAALATAWSLRNYREAMRLSMQAAAMQLTVTQLRSAGGDAQIKPCVDSEGRKRLCIRVDESAGKFKDSYAALAIAP